MRLLIILILALVSTSSYARSPDWDFILQNLLSQQISFDCDFTAKVDGKIRKKFSRTGTADEISGPYPGATFAWNPSNIPQSIRMVCDKQPDGTRYLHDIFDCNNLVPHYEEIKRNGAIYFFLSYRAEKEISPLDFRAVSIWYEGVWQNGKFVHLQVYHSDITTDFLGQEDLSDPNFKYYRFYHEFGTYGRQEITKDSCRVH